MMIILLHSSKTMRSPGPGKETLRQPQLIDKAKQLMDYLKTLSAQEIAKIMHVSPALANKTHELIAKWNTNPQKQSAALDSFVGDIYSGLQASSFSPKERRYADKHLLILSGLYGALRPLDAIYPYRLEMAYKLPQTNLYDFWGKDIAGCVPKNQIIINASSHEYTQAVLPYIEPNKVITPKFLTIDDKTKQPTFVVVHAKIARGAYAHWLITNQIEKVAKLDQFSDIGYKYSAELSTPSEPTYIAKQFGGKGLSMRLVK